MGILHSDLGLLFKALINLDSDIRNCRGQGYDGAADVSGHINGLSAHLCKINIKKFIHTAVVTGLI